MATRYCGDVTIRLSWRDNLDGYRCSVSGPDGTWHGEVLAPPALLHAVDSPEAYDRAAGAALAFAADDVRGIDDSAWPGDDGVNAYQISRKPPTRQAA